MDETNDRMVNQDVIDEELMNELKKANNQTYYLGDNRDRSDSEDEFKKETSQNEILTEEKKQNKIKSINHEEDKEQDEEEEVKRKNDSDDSEDEKDVVIKSKENRSFSTNTSLRLTKRINKDYSYYDYESDSKDCEK